MSIPYVRSRCALVAALLAIAPGAAAQWDPKGDAEKFTYVFDYPGHYVNDHALLLVDTTWHLYFIDGRRSDSAWSRPGNEVTIGHATSTDLLAWTPRTPALTVGPKGALDASHVYAPAVIAADRRFVMAYTGTERSFFSGEHLFLATSSDLDTWRRIADTPFFAPPSSWAMYLSFGTQGGVGGPYSGRDPFLFYDSAHGYILYYVARLAADSAAGTKDGELSCIAAATSPDLVNWRDRGPLVVRRTHVSSQAFSWNHPESPCLVRRNGWYYLFWKGGEGMRYVRSRDPLAFVDATEHRLSTSHASKIVRWDRYWYITSCSRLVDDVAHTRSDRTRGLYMAQIEWKDAHPMVVKLGTASPDDTLDVPVEPPPIYPPPPVDSVRMGSPQWSELVDGTGDRRRTVAIPTPAPRGATVVIPIASSVAARVIISDVLGNASDARGFALVNLDGRPAVALQTRDLEPGVYLVRIGATTSRIVIR